MKKNIFSIWHINSSFSSIEKNELRLLLDKSYWPLLELVEKLDFFPGIEINGDSIHEIDKIDAQWTKKLRNLLHKKKCNLIGSGYRQIIGPISPYKINIHNLKNGNLVYKSILNIKPTIGLVNEQCFSKSIIKIFLEAGYEALIMDFHSLGLNTKLTKNNCFLIDDYGNKIKLIKNNFISFQKFQQFIHNEIDHKNYYKYLKSISKKYNNFSIYGNDVEIFNFRPGRFNEEKKIEVDEWEKIYITLKNLSEKYNFISLNNIVKQKFTDSFLYSNIANSIPVKKQNKYNVVRWALSGKNDLLLNTFCFSQLMRGKQNLDFWASDLRTHITSKRWREIISKIGSFRTKFPKIKKKNSLNNNSLEIKTKFYILKLNLLKGGSILEFRDSKNKFLFGEMPKNENPNITKYVDLFSGHFVNETFDKKKFTDLNSKMISCQETKISKKIFFEKKFEKNRYIKEYFIDKKKGVLSINYYFKKIRAGSTRLGFLTFDKKYFSKKNLILKTHNGGNQLETFLLNSNFNHGERVNYRVTANNCIGATDGVIYIGDKKNVVKISFDRSLSAIYPMLNCGKDYVRVFFSISEEDDTFLEKTYCDLKVSINLEVFNDRNCYTIQ